MKKSSLIILSLFCICLYPFNAINPTLQAGNHNIYYTYSVPSNVLSIIQNAMDEVNPQNYISSATTPTFVSLLADPLNSTINPDTLTYLSADSLPIPIIYKRNSRINIHWGRLPDLDDLGKMDPNYRYRDIIIDSVKYKDRNYDLSTILKHEILHVIGLDHTTATFDGNPASDKIMYRALSANTVKYMTQDEINGLNDIYNRHYLAPPTPEQANGDPIHVVANDTINFMAKRNISIKDTLKANNEQLHPYDIDYYSDDGSQITFIDSVKMSTDSVLYKWNTSTTLGIVTVKTFIAGDESKTRPLNRTRVFEIAPWVDIQHTQFKADTYSLENINHFEATCTDALGNDYPYMDEVDGPMKFYYKEAGTDDEYTPIPSDPPVKNKVATAYSCTWNSGTLKGDYIVKATAFYKEHPDSTEVFNWSDSLTIRLLDGFECEITEPKPYIVEAIDFEKFVDIKGLLYNDGSVIVDTLETRYDIYDMQKNGRSVKNSNYADSMRCLETKYRWYSNQLPWPYGTPLKGSVSDVAFKRDDIQGNVTSKKAKSVVADPITWCNPLRNDTLHTEEDWLYETKPGLYKIEGQVYDAHMNHEVARRDTTMYMKPSWKLKLYGDFWYSYGAQQGVPYVEKTVYAPEEHVKFYQWRPFIERAIGETSFDVSFEGKSIANFIYSGNGYQQYIVNKPLFTGLSYIMIPDTFFVSTSSPAEWVRTGTDAPGFYQVTAAEYDPITGYNVIQKREIQIPPLYITAETDGSGWPFSMWPRGEEYENMENYNNWITDSHNSYTPALGIKSLSSYYRTIEHKGRMELTHPGVSITKDENLEFVFALGLKKELISETAQLYAFEELLAKYSIALVINDGEEEIIKTPTVNEWNEYDALNLWSGNSNDSIFYFVSFVKPLGKSVSIGSNIKIRLITEGLSEYFTDTLEQMVLYDEIRLAYTRKNCPEGPAMAKGSYKDNKGYDYVEITFTEPQNTAVAPTGYIIYRNGEKAGQTATTSFNDFNIESNKTYRYAVTAAYDGLDYPESSMLDCAFSVTTGQIINPRPRDFKLTQGASNEYNKVYLEWNCPVGDSATVYKVYRNDLMIAQTDTTIYADLWLNDGDYSYYITAKYKDDGESDPTDQKNVTINTIQNELPLLEGFENGGISPEVWARGLDQQNHPYNFWKFATINPRNSSANDGGYLAYMGAGPITSGPFNNINSSAYGDIISPILNLTAYKNITFSFKYLMQGDPETVVRLPQNFFKIEYATEAYIDPVWGNLYWDWEGHILTKNFDDVSDYNSDWQLFSSTITDTLFSDSTRFRISGQIGNEKRSQYLYYTIDSLVISGTIKAEAPTNLIITNNNGTINLTWDPVTDATQYNIYRSPFPDTGYQEIGTTAGITYNDEISIRDGKTYFYRVTTEVAQRLYPAKLGCPLSKKKVRK